VVAGLAAGIQKLDLTGVALSTPPADATTELKFTIRTREKKTAA